MECLVISQRFHRGFTAAEKAELWDRWQRGESLKAIGRAFSKPSSSITSSCSARGDSSCATASLVTGMDARAARGDLQRDCGGSVGTIDGSVAGSLAFDGKPRTQPEWRL